MTAKPREPLVDWREEITQELAEARSELEAARRKLEEAGAPARVAAAAYRQMQSVLSAIRHPAAPLAIRLQAHQVERDAARGREARVRGDLEAAQSRVAELERALRQLDQALSPAEAEEAA